MLHEMSVSNNYTTSSNPVAAAYAKLNYQKEVPGKRIGRYIGVQDTGELANILEQHLVSIRDARDLLPHATLDTFGFELYHKPTAVDDFQNDEEIHRVYYQEMEDVVLAATGAERVMIFDHTVRNTSWGASGKVKPKCEACGCAAVQRVHADYSDFSGAQRVQALLAEQSAGGKLLSKLKEDGLHSDDFCIVNVWRNISDECVQSKPLAMLDPGSVDDEDILTFEMQHAERYDESYAMRFNTRHQWYFYPRMERAECIVFKSWDSRKESAARCCFHTAFQDLVEPRDAPARRSIEVRAVAVMPQKTYNKGMEPCIAIGGA